MGTGGPPREYPGADGDSVGQEPRLLLPSVVVCSEAVVAVAVADEQYPSTARTRNAATSTAAFAWHPSTAATYPPHRSRPREARQAGYPDDSEHGILTRVRFRRQARACTLSRKVVRPGFSTARLRVFRYLVALKGRNKKGGTQTRRFFELLNTPPAALGVLVLAVAVNAVLFFGYYSKRTALPPASSLPPPSVHDPKRR